MVNVSLARLSHTWVRCPSKRKSNREKLELSITIGEKELMCPHVLICVDVITRLSESVGFLKTVNWMVLHAGYSKL